MSYFRVSGSLTEWRRADIRALPVFGGIDPSTKDAHFVRVGPTAVKYIRFESLDQSEANQFASDVYRRESIVCVVDEVFQ